MAYYTYIIQEDGNIFKLDLMLCDPLAHLLGDGLDGAVVERHLQAGGLAQLGVAGRAGTADEAQIALPCILLVKIGRASCRERV